MEESSKIPFARSQFLTKLKLGFLSLIAFGIMATSLYSIYQILRIHSIGRHNEEVRVETLTKTRTVAAFTKVYEMKTVSIPLVNRATTRIAYAQFSMTLDCASEEVLKSMELNRAKLLDTVYMVASNLYLEDFDKPAGLKLFKSQLMTSYQKHFGTLAPRRLTINDWVIN